MVLAYQPSGPGSNPARIIYFCHAFIHFFLRYGLCSKEVLNCVIYPFSDDKNLTLSKLKALADDKNVTQMIISVFDGEEKNVGKGENAGNQHFLLFPQCFEKGFFPRHV